MLHHSASAVCLTRPALDCPLGQRTFSTTHVGSAQSRVGSSHPGLNKRTTSYCRLGMSDEDTCTSSDAGFHPHKHLQRSSSSLGSRRGSAEGFEDAVESFEQTQSPSPDFDACYSSYAFSLRTPRGGASSKGVGASSPPKSEELKSTAPKDPTPCQSAKSPRYSRSLRAYTPALQESHVRRSSVASLAEHVSGEQEETAAPVSPSCRHKAPNHKAAATSPQEASSLEATGTKEQNEQPLSTQRRNRPEGEPHDPPAQLRVGSHEASLAVPRKNPISRYASVPAFSAADQLRIDRFKEGVQKSLSTQEALRLQREQEQRRQRDIFLRPSPYDCNTDLSEAVDWRSLLNAAGLGDVADEDIILEGEELQAKLDEYAPRSRFSWCAALWACLLQRKF